MHTVYINIYRLFKLSGFVGAIVGLVVLLFVSLTANIILAVVLFRRRCEEKQPTIPRNNRPSSYLEIGYATDNVRVFSFELYHEV
jgi:hypothetical protein